MSRRITIIAIILLASAGSLEALSLLQDASFSLRTTVSRLELSDGSQEQKVTKSVLLGRTQESYSRQQARAVVNYNFDGDGQLNVGRLYHDALDKVSLQYSYLSHSCKLIELKDFQLLPNLDVSKLKLEVPNARTEHVVGLARLLLFVEANKDKLQRLPEAPESTHNLPATLYSLTSGQTQLTIAYNDPNSTPMQIIVASTEEKTSYAISFSHVSMLPALEQMSITSDKNVEMDEFAYHHLCLDDLGAKREKIPLFNDLILNRFSFRANILYETDRVQTVYKPTNAQVAYSHHLKMMNIAYNNEHRGTNPKSSHKVINFKSNQVYQVVEYTDNSDGSGKARESCFVYKTSLRDYSTIGEMVTGSNFFVYLGQAWVRGKLTKMFGVSGGFLPRWLEQPLEYTGLDKVTKVREPVTGVEVVKDDSLMTFIYVTEGNIPTQIELYSDMRKITIEIFNFIWDFDKPASQLFSLQLACSKSDKTKHAELELLLGPVDGEKFGKEWSRNELEFRMLAVAQDGLSLNPVMVYDLETKVLDGQADLMSSFRVASQIDEVVKLEYVGKGKVKNEMMRVFLNTADTFQLCMQWAARSFFRGFFGFNMFDKSCWGMRQESDFSIYTTEKEKVRLDTLEIFKVEHKGDYLGDWNWLEHGEHEDMEQVLTGKEVIVPNLQPDSPFLGLRIKKIGMKMLNQQDLGSKTVKFNDLGLPAERPNTQFEPSERAWNHKTNKQLGITQAECRSACSASDSCQSYSVCLRPEGLECVLSPWNFQSTGEIAKLSTSKKFGERFEVELEGGKATLLKRLNCDLYNKLYSDHFQSEGEWTRVLVYFKRMVALKGGREECAKRCVRWNLKIMAAEAELATKINPLLNSKTSAKQLSELERLMKSRRENSERLCTAFYYLGRLHHDSENELNEDLGLNENDLESADSYCSLDIAQPPTSEEKDSFTADKSKEQRFKFTKYKFNLLNFYNVQKGVRLQLSAMGLEDQKAYSLARIHSSQFKPAQQARLRALVESGHNFQESYHLNEEKCAAACFVGKIEHSLGPWPMCSSFDVAFDRKMGHNICLLNSITLQQAIDSSLEGVIDDTANESSWIQWSHYEPGFLLQSSLEGIMEATMELDESNSFKSNTTTTFSGFGLFLIASIALIGGILVGIKLGQKLISLQQVKSGHSEVTNIAELDLNNGVVV